MIRFFDAFLLFFITFFATLLLGTWGLFIGLIISSLYLIFKELVKISSLLEKASHRTNDN
ncbi:hypothetical protein RYX45_06470 [Alkalihalophilus pseudofirmus]|uniref:Uncharacterized protein n=1 Tax=Alkalihalophilus pseudofirmus TaxID=79885 RepID=A0AAJ2KX96_ALKPS|nr:hypothetical protein [Alkalihalophilus pseudofirmus]MDV2884815.1 hypothetical protein [Alkalihalophilus pseudofirmus]